MKKLKRIGIPSEVIMTLIYIAGYVRRNNSEIHDIYFYYEIYGNYLMDMNHAGLKIPGDTFCQFTIYSYIIFHEVADLSGRSSFCNILILISEMYDFDINRNHGVILSNIIKNFCNMYFRRSCQESKPKILKLSV